MTDFTDGNSVTTVDGLAELYAPPIERVVNYKLDHVNGAGRAFIAASPFLVLPLLAGKALTARPRAIDLAS